MTAMRLPPFLQRLSPWMRYTLLAGMTGILLFASAAWAWPWRPGRLGGLIFGTLAALLFVNAGLYPWRRRWRARPLGTAQRWLQLHEYGSTLAMLFVLIHMGFRWPAGMMGWLLLLLSAWTTATGLAGVWIQRTVPRLMARRLTVEAIYERIPELVRALVAEADELMAGATDSLARAYAGEIRPVLDGPRASVGWLTGSTQPGPAAAAPLTRLRPFLSEADQSRLDDLATIIQDKFDLDGQLSLQRVLRGWLVLHVPPAVLLLFLLVTHVIAVVLH